MKINAQFATGEEWSALRLALDPEWRCITPENEEVSFCMLPEFWDLWHTVILHQLQGIKTIFGALSMFPFRILFCSCAEWLTC